MKRRSSRSRKTRNRRSAPAKKRRGLAAVPVTAAELNELKRQLERRIAGSHRNASPGRWNPDPDDVQRSVAQLVLTLVEFLRQLMERQAIRRMERRTLTREEVEAVGLALMRLEETVREMASRFGLAPEDLNLDLGPAGKLL
jgi:hypothetical protein